MNNDGISAEKAKKVVIDSWNYILGLDWFKLVRLFPFLKPVG